MEEYRAISRRPIAEIFRSTARAATAFCVRHSIHPDAISYSSLIASAAAALCFWKSGKHSALLLLAPLFCYLRLWCNMLDGMVALAAGKASARGEILNDLPDRISDLIIFVGVAHSGLMNLLIGYWCALLALLTAYVGLLGQAVGVHREFSGLMSKPWRMVALHLGASLMFAALHWQGADFHFGSLTILDWACLTIIAGCAQTIVLRLNRIIAALRARSSH